VTSTWKFTALDTGVIVMAAVAGFLFARWESRRTVAPSAAKPESFPVTLSEPTPRAVPEFRPLRDRVAKLPPVRRLPEVIDGRDLPRTARHLLDAIAGLKAADFRALCDGTANLPSMMAYGIDKSFGAAFARSFVERWLAVDEKGALESLPGLAKKAQGAGAFTHGPILQALIAARPREALQTFLAMEPDDARGPVSSGVKDAFIRLASENPASARKLLDGCRDAAQRKTAELGIALGLAENDPSSGAAVAVQMNSAEVFQAALAAAEKIGDSAVFEIALKGNASLLPTYALNGLALRFPNAPWESIAPDAWKSETGIPLNVLETAALVSPEARARLLGRSADLPAFMKKDVQYALLMSWADDAPRDAMDWALQNAAATDSNSDIVALVFSKWQAGDRESAVAWLQSLPEAALRDRFAPRVRDAPKPVEEKPDPAVATSRALAAGDAREPFDSLVKKWFVSDPEAAAQWTLSLTDAQQRDRAFRAYAKAAASRDPAAAREWIDGISDPRIRGDAARDLVLSTVNKAAMHEWVGGLREILPLRKQWLLRITE